MPLVWGSSLLELRAVSLAVFAPRAEFDADHRPALNQELT
jgi:hypothetical protein